MTTKQHGGARPATRPDDGRHQNGGHSTAGRKPERTNPDVIRLSKAAQQELSIIFAAVRSMRSPTFTKRQLIEELIHERWLVFDEQVQANGEELAEVEITDNAIIL